MLKSSLLLLIMKLSGKEFKRELRAIESISEGEVDLGSFIEESLKGLLILSHSKVRYYRRLLEEAGVIEDGKVDLQNFSKISTLKGEDIQSHFQELLSKDLAKRGYYIGSTSGFTGKPIRFVRGMNSYRWAKATEFFYYDRFIGINEMTAKKAVIWSHAREILHGISIKR